MMEIREATEADLPALAALARKTFLAAWGHHHSTEENEALIQETRSPEAFQRQMIHDSFVVAWAQDRPVSFAQVGAVKLPIDHLPGDQELRRLYVHPDHIAKGIGSQTIEAVLRLQRLKPAKGLFLQVWTENLKAAKLYRRFGFEQVGLLKNAHKVGADDFIMRKAL